MCIAFSFGGSIGFFHIIRHTQPRGSWDPTILQYVSGLHHYMLGMRKNGTMGIELGELEQRAWGLFFFFLKGIRMMMFGKNEVSR